jgi:hypothetical protein
MRHLLLSAILIFGLAVPIGTGQAQGTATVTATCKDGSTFSGTTRAGACRGHGGVQTWGPPVATAPTPAAPPPQAAPTAAGSTPAAPSGKGQVWVNTASKVYHCPGTRYYGKTKQGAYMSEAQARAQGDRPAYGKGCGS